jgi:hypothetical protein
MYGRAGCRNEKLLGWAKLVEGLAAAMRTCLNMGA